MIIHIFQEYKHYRRLLDEIEARILERLRSGEGGMLVDEKTFLRPTSDIAGWQDP